MPGTMRAILGGKNLTGVIQAIKSGLPDDILPPAYMRPGKTVEGNTGTYTRVKGVRETMRQTPYGGPSRQRGQTETAEVPVTLIHILESEFHKPVVLQNLLSLNGAKQKLGREEVSRQVREFKRLMMNTRVAAMFSLLALGRIYFDGEGNLLPSATGAKITVDFNLPAQNRDQISNWGSAGTDIPDAIIGIKDKCVQNTGYRIKHAYYGSGLLKLLLANTAVKELINQNPALSVQAYKAGAIPQGLMDLEWHPMHEAFYVDANGAVQTFFGPSHITFTPEPVPDVYELLQGTYPVPTDIGSVVPDAVSALSKFKLVAGQFSYAIVTTDPPSIKHVAGDTFLPVWKVPDAMFIETDVTSA